METGERLGIDKGRTEGERLGIDKGRTEGERLGVAIRSAPKLPSGCCVQAATARLSAQSPT